MSISLETFDKLKQQLRAARDVGTPLKQDLYTHLFEVFNRIMLHHPNDGFEKFEEISALVKYHNFKIADPKPDFEVRNNGSASSDIGTLIAALDKFRALLAEQPDLVSADDRGLVAQEFKCSLPNYVDHAAILETAGIGFGEDMSLMVQKSLRRLAKLSGASQLKFFGKIFGTQADYWVAQGVLNFEEEAARDPQQEKRGQGVNATVFWVTTNLVGDWIQLPDVQPIHIILAQKFKKLFTGNLNAKIDSNPPFPGSEKHLLRA